MKGIAESLAACRDMRTDIANIEIKLIAEAVDALDKSRTAEAAAKRIALIDYATLLLATVYATSTMTLG